MKIFSGLIIGLSLFFMGPVRGFAQTQDSLKYHVAVFLPLYLDSAFDAAGNYRFDQNFPKYLNPGLEFYEGLELAMDSLNKKSTSLDITVYDTRSTKKSIQQMLDEPAFSKMQLILGYVNSADLHVLANVAKNREIPFINVNFPNDGAVTGNPEYVILNSTLRAHCEALYKFIQRNWATSNIFYVRRATQDDDRLRSYFAEIEKNTPSIPLRMKYVNIDNTQNISQITSSMDSNSKTVILVGSLDENFGKSICSKLDAFSKSYPMKILGMPTWDAITDFNAPSYADLEIYYTTPFYLNPADSLVVQIQQNYKTRFYSRPSDMVYRGYETTLHFGQLLEAHKGHLDGSIGERKYKVFNDFDIQPVFSSGNSQPGQSPTLQYLENKKLYFLKKVNGNVVAVY
ncbi:MAG TPA: ABC transporter substrate-binding protein [Puia sp.]|nr:ABC transporter substrate-binding protein [Puia sp.]